MDIFREIINKTKNDKLDPLTVVVKLFIFAYKPVGTKIAIHNNKIHIQNVGLFQSTVRTIYGDSKNDINIIFAPILFACQHYLKNNYKIFTQQYYQLMKKRFFLLFEKMLFGFDKLKLTYQTNEITYLIDQLKNLIKMFFSPTDEDMLNISNTSNTLNISDIAPDEFTEIDLNDKTDISSNFANEVITNIHMTNNMDKLKAKGKDKKKAKEKDSAILNSAILNSAISTAENFAAEPIVQMSSTPPTVTHLNAPKTSNERFITDIYTGSVTDYISHTNQITQIKCDIYKHISSIWTNRRLNVLFGYVDEIIEFANINPESELLNNLVESLGTYMNCIDTMTIEIISSIN